MCTVPTTSKKDSIKPESASYSFDARIQLIVVNRPPTTEKGSSIFDDCDK